MLIIHEFKGRAAGWLTAATAAAYRKRLDAQQFATSLGLSRDVYDVHAVYVPEMMPPPQPSSSAAAARALVEGGGGDSSPLTPPAPHRPFDFQSEIARLRRCMDRCDNVNIFVAQGTANAQIEAELRHAGKDIERHPTLGYAVIDTAEWLANKLKAGLKAEKVLIQRSGVFVRAAPSGEKDLRLTQSCVNYAVDVVLGAVHAALPPSCAFVVGHDERHASRLGLIEVAALSHKRPFDVTVPWFTQLLGAIGQPQLNAVTLQPTYHADLGGTAFFNASTKPSSAASGSTTVVAPSKTMRTTSKL